MYDWENRKHASGYTNKTDLPLYWVSYGNPSADRILVLHGGPGAQHDYLLPQMLALSEKHQIILYDQRGGGRSRDDTRESITWETHVRDLAAIVSEFELQPLTLLGYSWGGLLALLYAVRSMSGGKGARLILPSRIVLVSPAPAAARHRKAMEAEFTRRQQSPDMIRKREDLSASGLRESDPDAWRKRLFELSVAGYFNQPERARELTPFRVTARVQESVWNSLGDYDLLPALGELRIPALVVHGRDDPIPTQSSLEIADALSARALVLEKCGHVPYVEQPLALFSAIETFLDTYKPDVPE